MVVSADRHWIALDHAFSRALSPAQAGQARQRFAHRAAALNRIYLRRLVDTALHDPDTDSDSTGTLAELQDIYRELSDALSLAWGIEG
jgi:hypothetical protein